MTKIQFIGIGRGKKTWTASVPWREDAIVRHLRKSKALMSRGIDVEMTASTAVVLVGGFRQVGTFRKVDGEEAFSA